LYAKKRAAATGFLRFSGEPIFGGHSAERYGCHRDFRVEGIACHATCSDRHRRL